MSRLPLSRSLPLALLGLTLVMAVVAGLSVAGLYSARQDYEDELARAYRTETAAADLRAAAVFDAALRAGRAADRRGARRALDGAGTRLRAAARGDAESERLAAQAVRTRGRAAIVERLARRQETRRVAARDEATAASRRATITAAIAGGLALLAAFLLASGLISGMRRPLDALVSATRRLAAGDLDARVEPQGPRELRELAASFNAMGADLAAAREAVEAERRRLAVIIESLGDALVVCDAAGTIIEVNPRARELVPALEPGTSLADQVGPMPRLHEVLDREVELEHGGRTLSVTAGQLGADGADGVVFTARDVSERARLERLKSEFVATASHELRSPLTSIKGFVELLGASPSLTAKQREFVDIILLSTNRLVDLVNDLLDVAQVEAGRVQIARRPVAVEEVVREVATLMQPRVAEAGQHLEVDVAPELPPADADPARVRQIVTNLLTNAHLYTPAGGALRVAVTADDSRVAIAVSDTGRGMDADQLAHVFDRFYRVRTAGGPSGSGLGLSIVRSLVDLHGGSIDVISTPGEGSTFTVRLARAELAPAGPDRAMLEGKRVLVVDDDPDIARLIASQLEPWAVDTVLVSSGEEAIERLRAEPFDAVTLDILMAGMSGFEVLRAVRADADLRDTPIVVVSVFSSREALAGEWVVSKPIDADELTGALGSAMLAGRTRVIVIGRDTVREEIAGALDALGIDYDWASAAETANRLCAARRYEVALVDACLDAPQDIIAGLDLRGRRERRCVLVFSDGEAAPGLARLDAEPVGLQSAGAAVLAALGEDGAR